MTAHILAPTLFMENINLAYRNGKLFQHFNLTLRGGEFTCLLGPSGVGKSTLLHLIANLIPKKTQWSGNVYCNGTQPLAEQISYMAQNDLLLPWLTALENALLSFRLLGKTSSEIIEQAHDLFLQMGLKEAIHHYPGELSGGMKQRVALIRTLLQNKPIVLMDEPFSKLDTITRFQMQTLSAKLLKNKTVVLVTHDPLEALRLADQIYIVSGKPAMINSPIKLLSPTPRDPANPEFMLHQADLFHALMQANEVTNS